MENNSLLSIEIWRPVSVFHALYFFTGIMVSVGQWIVRLGSCSRSSHTKNSEIVFAAYLLYTQYHKVPSRGTLSYSGKRVAQYPTPRCTSY